MFLKITTREKEIYLNPSNVRTLEDYPGGGLTTVTLDASSSTGVLYVKEPSSYILSGGLMSYKEVTTGTAQGWKRFFVNMNVVRTIEIENGKVALVFDKDSATGKIIVNEPLDYFVDVGSLRDTKDPFSAHDDGACLD